MSAPREPTPGTQNAMVLAYLVRHGIGSEGHVAGRRMTSRRDSP